MVDPLRIGIAGGSLGGLTAAVLLHELGHDVHVFERSTEALKARGAGIVVLPATERYFTEQGTDFSDGVALTLTNWSYMNREGEVTSRTPTHNRFSSWNTMYRALLKALPSERYHLNREVVGLTQSSAQAHLEFADGSAHRCDLLLGIDGVSSTLR